MYDDLGVRYHSQRFLFCFSRLFGGGGGGDVGMHFIHSSNNHRIPPIRPPGVPLFEYLFETVYLLVWYFYFAFCCLFIQPRPTSGRKTCESLEGYLRRIHLPAYFTNCYLVPLMSSVATCSHSELLAFPAQDLIEYKRKTTGAEHYVVSDGVRDVQEKLARGLDIRLETSVIEVEPEDEKVQVHWRHNNMGCEVSCEEFDRVVLAVSPAVVGAIFRPLKEAMTRIPTTSVTSVVHRGGSGGPQTWDMRLGTLRGDADVIHFQTSKARTQSIHVYQSGTLVTTCPLQPNESAEVIQESSFTRVLRTTESKRIVNALLGNSASQDGFVEEKTSWKNGDGGVWIAGGWCWDGLVLLEGCIVSAMRVADDFGVSVPWRGRDS